MTDVPRTGPEPLGEGPRGRGPTVSTRPCPWPCGPQHRPGPLGPPGPPGPSLWETVLGPARRARAPKDGTTRTAAASSPTLWLPPEGRQGDLGQRPPRAAPAPWRLTTAVYRLASEKVTTAANGR